MADADTTIHIKTTADNSGAKSTEKALGGVENAAKRASGGISGAFKSVSGAVSKASAAVGQFTKALGLIGMAISGVQLIVGLFQKVRDWLARNKKAAEELNKAIQDAKNAAAVDNAAASYEKLNKRISETLRLEQERDRLAAQKQSADRSAEDQFAELEMQRELATVAADDPDRAQKETLIRNKYARAASDRNTIRARQDLAERIRKLSDGSADDDSRADAFEREIEKSGDAVGSLRRQIAAEKDPERKKVLEGQLDAIIKENQKKRDSASKLRESAKSKQAEASNLLGSDRAEVYRNKAENLRLDASDRDARNQMSANASERRRKDDERKARDEQLAGQRADLMAQRGRIGGQIQDAVRARALARSGVESAQSAYSSYGGSSQGEVQRLYNALQTAQKALDQSDKTVETLTRALQTVTGKLDSLEKAASRQDSRARGA